MLKINRTLQSPDDGNAAGGAPAAAPAVPPAADDPAVKWGDLAEDSDEDISTTDDGGVATPPPASAPPATPEPPATPPSPTPPAEPPKVETPPAPTPPADPEAQRRAVEEARLHVESEMTKYFGEGMTDEDKASLIANPELVLPKLLARAAMAATQMTLAQIPRIVPAMVAQTAQVQTQSAGAWKMFDEANPDLAKPEYRQATLAAVKALKTMGTKLSDEQAVLALGRMVRAAQNLPDPGTAQDPPATAQPIVPFTPVARGTSTPATPAKAPTKEQKWSDLATD